MIFFSNRQGCRFRLWFLNRQLNRQLESESATGGKIGYVRIWTGEQGWLGVRQNRGS